MVSSTKRPRSLRVTNETYRRLAGVCIVFWLIQMGILMLADALSVEMGKISPSFGLFYGVSFAVAVLLWLYPTQQILEHCYSVCYLTLRLFIGLCIIFSAKPHEHATDSAYYLHVLAILSPGYLMFYMEEVVKEWISVRKKGLSLSNALKIATPKKQKVTTEDLWSPD